MPANSRKTPARRLVRKASVKNGDWVAVYDAKGKLVGIVDPAKITPVADGADAEPVTKRQLSAARTVAEEVQVAKAMDVAALRKLQQIKRTQR